MAKPELRDHRKFLKLRRLLNEPTPHLIGYLECLWIRGYQTGNPEIGDSLDVESAAEYPGEVGRFTQAALTAGFIDRIGEDRYQIHDLYHHAPKYARLRMHRRGTAPKKAPVPLYHQDEDDDFGPDDEGTNVPDNDTSGTNVPECGTNVPESDQNGIARTPKPISEILNPKASKTPLPPSRGEDECSATLHEELTAAVAAATGLDPAANSRGFREVVDYLVAASPPFTAAEVAEFRRRFHELCPTAKDRRPRPGLRELKKNIGLVREVKSRTAPPKPKTDLKTLTDDALDDRRSMAFERKAGSVVEDCDNELARRKGLTLEAHLAADFATIDTAGLTALRDRFGVLSLYTHRSVAIAELKRRESG